MYSFVSFRHSDMTRMTANADKERSDAVTIVFGATGGIGSEVCRQLRASGRSVMMVARREAGLAGLSEELGARYAVGDVTQASAVQRCFEEARKHHDRCVGVAHCVGSILLKPAHLTSDQEWADTIALNLTSAFHVVREAVGWMRESGGSVVLVSSVAARRGLSNHEAIAAAKAGIVGLTQAAAASYARQSIRFNCVAPGLVRTPLTQSLTSNEVLARKSAAMHPLGRIGEPAAVASAIVWLLDPQQSWVTGQVLSVDGGMSCVNSPWLT
jgi:NAD(P)-dependent dehydrogenase (short-subunit alcohol dehydrogenase family)